MRPLACALLSRSLLLLVGALVVLAAACGGSGSSSQGPFGDGLPSDFPAAFPVYPEAQLQSSGQVAQGGSQLFGVAWETPDSVAQVVAFYEGRFRELDWLVSVVPQSGGGAVLRFASEGDALGGELRVVDNGERSQIVVFFNAP